MSSSQKLVSGGFQEGINQTADPENRPHVLVVDDEPPMLHILRATMDFGELTCDVATTAAEALQKLKHNRYDVIITDLGLPDWDGGRLIEAIRAKSDTPIVVISGHDTEQEKIRVLDLGADDFLGKPFLPGELLARIRAVLRRVPRQETSEQPLRADDFHWRMLAPAERMLFELLARHEGAVVTPQQIFDHLWEGRPLKANLGVLVSKLRLKLEANNASLKIVNKRGAGYLLRRE